MPNKQMIELLEQLYLVETAPYTENGPSPRNGGGKYEWQFITLNDGNFVWARRI